MSQAKEERERRKRRKEKRLFNYLPIFYAHVYTGLSHLRGNLHLELALHLKSQLKIASSILRRSFENMLPPLGMHIDF